MPQPVMQARPTIFLASEPTLTLVVPHESALFEREESQGALGAEGNLDAESSLDSEHSSDSERSPESYIRELTPEQLESDAELWLAHIKAHTSPMIFETIDDRFIQELPSLHPILDQRTPLQWPAVLPPPQLSLLKWLWLALLCA